MPEDPPPQPAHEDRVQRARSAEREPGPPRIDDGSWVRRRARRLLGPALRRLLDTDDLVQEARAVELKEGTPERFPNRRARRAWLGVVLRNLAAKAARRVDRRDETRSGWSALAGREKSPSARLHTSEQRAALRALLRRLDDRDRKVVTLRIVEGLPFREVAARLELSEAHARVIFSRAVARLRSSAVPSAPSGTPDRG